MTLIQKLTAIMLFANLLVIAGAAGLLFWPAHLPIIYNEPFPVRPEVVYKGDTLFYTMELRKDSQYNADWNRNIICEDGNLVTLSPQHTDMPIGKQTVTGSIVIPQKASFSVCYLQLEVSYQVNPLRREHQTMRTQSFTIVK